jgi:putative ABC transport system permease protein
VKYFYTALDWIFTPLNQLAGVLKEHPGAAVPIYGTGVALLVALAVLVFVFRKYFIFIGKSLFRNLLRTLLAGIATMVLVFVVTLIVSILVFLGKVTEERSKDLMGIVTERYQIPSQMPFSYADTLAQGAARSDHPEDVVPQDCMTWQFFGGTLDPTKMTRENIVFFFALNPGAIDPRRERGPMMADLQDLNPGLIDKLAANKKGCLMGRERLEALNKRVGERFILTGLNYKDIVLEFDVVGMLPEGRYNQSAIMNRDYLNDALDQYKRSHNGTPHPMANKTLNLVWLRVPDTPTFQKLAEQVMTSSLYSQPYVKCETASSGIASWLDAYRDLIWAMKWLLVPAILITMSLVIANAISISVRERRTEMAVLKVLGYGPGRIMMMVLGEAVLVGVGGGLLSAAVSYTLIHVVMKGIKFPIAFFPVFDIYADALWWGFLFGGLTSLAGSILPAWSARTVKVSEVFSKVS